MWKVQNPRRPIIRLSCARSSTEALTISVKHNASAAKDCHIMHKESEQLKAKDKQLKAMGKWHSGV